MREQASIEPQAAAPGGMPAHVAIIMDGNGRWAAARHLPRIAGHRSGAESLRQTIEAAIHAGVEWLTIYAFSSENWRRSPAEVFDLTGLLRHYLRHEVATLSREGVRLRFLGERERFDDDVRRELDRAEHGTAANTRLNLNIALSYGSRAEIVMAARKLAMAARDEGLDLATVDEAGFAKLLFTADMPEPDLVIRTGGDRRLSNFLLWQSAYAELVFVDQLWPDFDGASFDAALVEFARRERRFGARPV